VTGRIVAPAPIEPQAAARSEPADNDLPDPGEGIDPGLRRAVLADLEAVESLRAKIASAAGDLLSRTIIIERVPASPVAVVSDAIAAVALEARLRGVRLEMIWPDSDESMTMDGQRCRTVLIGLLQCMLSLSTGETTALEVKAQVTIVRPALIVECRLRQDGREQVIAADEALGRFFDGDWREHPCGEIGARSLAALSRVARAHGGRVQASPAVVTFIVPRPLTDC
jgi:hypothetical protein